jgi:hypothetical protein
MKMQLTILLLTFVCSLPSFATDPTEKKASQHNEGGIFYSADQQNLLKNPDFSNSTSCWTLGKFNGGNATFFTDSLQNPLSGPQAIVVSGGSFTDAYEDIQLFSSIEISQNTIYSITFEAFVKKASLISISVGNGMDAFYDEKLLLRPEQTIYGPFTFKSGTDEAFAFFSFNLGRTNATLGFDNVSITADNTEKQFQEIVTNTGINIHPVGHKELYIQLPTVAKTDYPVICVNGNGKAVRTDKIREGSQELFFRFDENLQAGNYTIKVFAPEKTVAYNFQVK